MPPAGFEPAMPASGRPLTHILVCAATKDRQQKQLYSYEFRYFRRGVAENSVLRGYKAFLRIIASPKFRGNVVATVP
jgi:hypothetical protein